MRNIDDNWNSLCYFKAMDHGRGGRKKNSIYSGGDDQIWAPPLFGGVANRIMGML